MKSVYIFFYILSGIFFCLGILGTSVTKPLIDKFTNKVLSTAGLNLNSIQSIDNKLDELIYKSKQIELQIEKIKNFFSSEKVDESKYQKEKSEILESAVYKPIAEALNTLFITSLFMLSIFFLLFAMIFHGTYKYIELRKRVKRLEQIIFGRNQVTAF